MAEAARSGALRRNFQGYTTDTTDALLGFGRKEIAALATVTKGLFDGSIDPGEIEERIERSAGGS